MTSRVVALPERAITHRVRVGYGDTDQAGIVHHSVYLRWAEAARVEYLRHYGLDYRRFELDQRLALPVVDAHLRYRSPARFDDQIELVTWVGELSRAKVRFDCRVECEGRHLTDIEITLCCIKLPEAKIVSMPEMMWRACRGEGAGA